MSYPQKFFQREQIIRFEKFSKKPNLSRIVSEDVIVIPTHPTDNECTSNLKGLETIDYSWLEKYYCRRYFAIHSDSHYLAYGVNVNNKRDEVRVLNYATAPSQRKLLKSLNESLDDIAFASKTDSILLAFITGKGYVYIYQIVNTNLYGRKFDAILYASLSRESNSTTVPFSLSWCHFIPNDGNNSECDCSEYLLLTYGKWAEIWNIKKQHEKYGEHMLTDYDSCLLVHSKVALILYGNISPDGSTSYFIYSDGCVRFYNNNFDENLADLVQEWKPHGENVVTMLHFLDNYEIYRDKFWKYAVSGAKNNTEIKIWNCKNWTVLQKLHFKDDTDIEIKLEDVLDSTAKYLLLYEKTLKVLYVLHIDKSASRASIMYIAEFYLMYDINKLAIHSVSSLADEIPLKNVIRLIVVYPKSIQNAFLKHSLQMCETITDVSSSDTTRGKPTLLRNELIEQFVSDTRSVINLSDENVDDNIEDNLNDGDNSKDNLEDAEERKQEVRVTTVQKTTNVNDEHIPPYPLEDYNKKPQMTLIEQVNELIDRMEKTQAISRQNRANMEQLQNMCTINFDMVLKHAADNGKMVKDTCSKNREQMLQMANSEVRTMIDRNRVGPSLEVVLQYEITDMNTKLNAKFERMMEDINIQLNNFSRKDVTSENAYSSRSNVINLRSLDDELMTLLRTNIVPIFERGCTILLNDINNVVVKKVEASMKLFTKQAETMILNNVDNREIIRNKINSMINTVNDKTDHYDKSVSRIPSEIRTAMGILTKNQIDFVEKYFSKLTKRLINLDKEDFKKGIVRLMSSGKTNEALAKVVMLGDQSLLIFACEKMDRYYTFNTISEINHEIALNLLQLLSEDLAFNAELRLRFIKRVICSFKFFDDVKDDKKAYVKVFTLVKNRLSAFLSAQTADYKDRRSVSMLICAFESL